MNQINAVAVVALDTLGAGIAEVFARAGHTVRGIEHDDGAAAIATLCTTTCLTSVRS